MCELLGVSCQTPDRASKSLTSFQELSRGNPDGWGLAYYQDGHVIVEKEAKKAVSSQKFTNLIQNVKSNIIIAHLRLATRGEVCTNNCHPFPRSSFNRDWVFAHNGTIRNISHHQFSQGTTDSEQVFHKMIDDIETYMHQSQFHGLYPGIKQSIKNLFETYSRNITFNFLLSDGSVLYAFNHYPGTPLYIASREKDYGGAIVISTEKLHSRDYSEWKQLPKDRVILIADGRVLVLSNKI
jgi:glutamine amidotransferase